MQVSDKAGDKKKCKMIGKKTIRNFASKNSIYISILMILFTWVLKKEWMGLIKVLGWEKKQLHVLVLGMVFLKKLQLANFVSVMIFCLLQILQPGIC